MGLKDSEYMYLCRHYKICHDDLEQIEESDFPVDYIKTDNFCLFYIYG